MSNPFDDLKSDDDKPESGSDSSASTSTATPEAESTDDASPATDVATESASTPPSSSPSEPESGESVPSQDDASSAAADSSIDNPSEPSPPTETGDDDTVESKPEPAETGPAFEYSDVRQKPLYARDSTWDELEDELGITVIPALRRMGIRDEETREIHDAVLKVAIEHSDELPDAIADVRRRSR